MSRSSMAAIITNLRLMTDDVSPQMFTDDQLQTVLDRNGCDERYEELEAVETIAPGGAVTYKLYLADDAPWETDAALCDSLYNTITSGSADYTLGRFTFTSNQPPPVMITGRTYDMNGAAADVWDLKAAKFATGFDFSADGGSYSLSQKAKQAREQAAYFRSISEEATGFNLLEREDVNP